MELLQFCSRVFYILDTSGFKPVVFLFCRPSLSLPASSLGALLFINYILMTLTTTYCIAVFKRCVMNCIPPDGDMSYHNVIRRS